MLKVLEERGDVNLEDRECIHAIAQVVTNGFMHNYFSGYLDAFGNDELVVKVEAYVSNALNSHLLGPPPPLVPAAFLPGGGHPAHQGDALPLDMVSVPQVFLDEIVKRLDTLIDAKSSEQIDLEKKQSRKRYEYDDQAVSQLSAGIKDALMDQGIFDKSQFDNFSPDSIRPLLERALELCPAARRHDLEFPNEISPADSKKIKQKILDDMSQLRTSSTKKLLPLLRALYENLPAEEEISKSLRSIVDQTTFDNAQDDKGLPALDEIGLATVMQSLHADHSVCSEMELVLGTVAYFFLRLGYSLTTLKRNSDVIKAASFVAPSVECVRLRLIDLFRKF